MKIGRILILIPLFFLMLNAGPSRALVDVNTINFNTYTTITAEMIVWILEDLTEAIDNRDAQALADLIPPRNTLEIQNWYWTDEDYTYEEREHLVLRRDFDPSEMSTIRHYCFGAGAEDYPISTWELLSMFSDIDWNELTVEHYPPHPENLDDYLGRTICYPSTEYYYPSLTGGIDACVKVWNVGDYIHGKYNGTEIYLIHTTDSNDWYVRSIKHYYFYTLVQNKIEKFIK